MKTGLPKLPINQLILKNVQNIGIYTC